MPELMDGVTILNTVPSEEPLDIWICLVVGALIMMLPAIFVSFGEKDATATKITVSVFCTIGCIMGAVFCKINNSYLHPERYEVIISDDVSMNEFIERYEIVEKNGQIYTIEVKTE